MVKPLLPALAAHILAVVITWRARGTLRCVGTVNRWPQVDSFGTDKTFEDLIKIANKDKEVELKFDLERNVKLVNFAKGKINITFNEKLNKNFIKILTEKLLNWTGERWIISLTKEEGAETYYEKITSDKENKLNKERNNDLSKKLQTFFPDAKLVDVKEEDISD